MGGWKWIRCAWGRIRWLLGLDDGFIGVHYTIEYVSEFSVIKSFFKNAVTRDRISSSRVHCLDLRPYVCLSFSSAESSMSGLYLLSCWPALINMSFCYLACLGVCCICTHFFASSLGLALESLFTRLW